MNEWIDNMEKEITSEGYQMPSLELLDEYIPESEALDEEEEEELSGMVVGVIWNILERGKVRVKGIEYVLGPAVTLYKIFPEQRTKISQVRSLVEETLNLERTRVVTLEDSIGIEIANDHREVVPMRSVLSKKAFRDNNAELPVDIGRTFGNEVMVFDLAKAPHLLIAGATKQGKTTAIHAIVASLLYSKHPEELKFVFIDPKGCEFSVYERLSGHYIASVPGEKPIVQTTAHAAKTLAALCEEMDHRYELLSRTHTSNICAYNKRVSETLPYIVTIIDEYADLTIPAGRDKEARNMSHSITESIIRLAQCGRAVGIHVVLTTQRPLGGIASLVKANFPARIAVRTISATDSRIILDTPGAERLIGSGDMIFQIGGEETRLQGACISPEEIDRLTSYVESSPDSGSPYCLPTSFLK